MSFRATLQFFSSLWLVLLVSFPLQAAPETASDAGRTLRVGMPLPGQIPFFWQDETGAFQGIYADTLRLIAEDLDVELDFIPLSQARLQRLFIAGEIDIEAGVSPQLDVPDALQQVSLYSIPFGIVNEVIIYRPELSFPVFILKDLEGQRVATVRGASVPDNLIREDFASQWQIAQRVHRGWNQIGLINEATALRYQSEENLNYEISLPYASNAVTFRLHRARSALLQQLNASIARLEQQGELERLVCKYRCGTH
ncbi:substrate-binding periplasmic protein [Aliamphritea spongicola]|uniref:substrate-binding periplasmic protein n=1 Tax=Aliamphritea spongicola TaxID=707589 RepID=UPI00196B0C86|nr:transporter substrate-binding domain-containing protein [Aliamphritea spongicola]MBN3562076.1 transporter substrate-binding domain-containing protein [Aliamphritea spongicola]